MFGGQLLGQFMGAVRAVPSRLPAGEFRPVAAAGGRCDRAASRLGGSKRRAGDGQPRHDDRGGHDRREMLQLQRITISGIRAGRPLSGSGPRGTAPPTSIPHGRSVRQVGMCRSTATHRLRSLSGCPSRWTAWPRCHPPTPPTGRSTRCHTSAQPPRASTPRWTFPRSSRRWDEKRILLSRELKLPEMSLLLTPAPGRCQSYETNSSHLSYATLIHREATR